MVKQQIINSPINWYGGKGGIVQRKLLNKLLKFINNSKAERFVDVFGGSGIVTINVNVSERIYNDKNSYLTNFFKILKNTALRNKLEEKLTLTPYSEIEYIESRDKLGEKKELNGEKSILDIDEVVSFYIATMQSREANGAINSKQTWKCKGKNRRGMSMAVSSWLRNIDENMPDVVERLREVEVTNQDVIECLNRWDGKKTIFYLDPPYEKNTRREKKAYGKFELSEDKHREIVEKLLMLEGQAIVSGYNNDIYNNLLQYGWKKEEFNLKTSTTIGSENNGQRKEVIWYNLRKLD